MLCNSSSFKQLTIIVCEEFLQYPTVDNHPVHQVLQHFQTVRKTLFTICRLRDYGGAAPETGSVHSAIHFLDDIIFCRIFLGLKLSMAVSEPLDWVRILRIAWLANTVCFDQNTVFDVPFLGLIEQCESKFKAEIKTKQSLVGNVMRRHVSKTFSGVKIRAIQSWRFTSFVKI